MIVDYPTARISLLDVKALKELVRHGEGQTLEFKLKTNHPEKIVKGVVAFANSKGGKLLIGVGDDRSVKGLKFADEDEFLLVRAIEKYCYPMIDYEIEKVVLEDEREVLIFDIKPSPMKPHYVDLDGIPENRKAYVRVADKSIQASKEMKEILKGERKNVSIKFQFGEKEKILMQYLADNQFITIDTFIEIAQINRKNASRTLVILVLANVLKIQPSDSIDKFVSIP